jgi:methylphosphotriester-DNA--protein-cysteine methyltransferase
MGHRLDITRDAAVSLLLLKDNSLDRRVLKILEMVEAGTTLAIRDLAAESRLSPAYLQRLFKNETGICMGEWLSEQRICFRTPIFPSRKSRTRSVTNTRPVSSAPSNADSCRHPHATESKTTASTRRRASSAYGQREGAQPEGVP